MDIWKILDIAPTTDVKTIKKAYAARSKEYHPEEYPEEFQRLQNAYKIALEYAKRQESGTGKPMHEAGSDRIVRETESREADSNTTDWTERKEKEDSDEPPYVKTQCFDYDEVGEDDIEAAFWERLEYVLWHPCMREKRIFWEFFLYSPGAIGLMESTDFRRRFIQRLRQENFLWAKDVLQVLNTYMEEYPIPPLQKRHFRLRNHFFKNKLGNRYWFESPEERELFQIIWWGVKEEERESPESYLKMYFAYADENDENKETLQRIHRKAHRARARRPWQRILKCALVLLLLLGFRAIVALDKEMEQQRRTQQTIEQMQEGWQKENW